VLSYKVAVRNRGPFLYPGAEYRFYNAELMELEGDAGLGMCEPFRGQQREYEVRFPYRGVYELGLESLSVTDMFGLFRRTIRNKQPLRLTVFPEGDAEFELTMRAEPQDIARRQDVYSEDFSTVADLRKYNPADSLRKIHWKLSAKRGELITKNFQNFEPERTLLLLDTAKINLPPKERAAFEDKMVSYAASAVDFCLRAKVPASLIYGQPGVEETTLGTPEDADGLYALLAGITFDRECSPIYELRNVPGAYNIVGFLSGLDERRCAAIKELSSLGHNLTLYVFESRLLSLGTPPQPGARGVSVPSPADLIEHKNLLKDLERQLGPLPPLGDMSKYLIEELRAVGVAVTPVTVDQPGTPATGEGGAA